jgi:hypothetical protein
MSNLMVHTERFTRSRDPESSHEAAELISREGWTALMGRVYDIVAYAHIPLTRDQIFAIYDDTRDGYSLPRVTPQRVRTAVRALLDGERADFAHVTTFARALVVADTDGRSDAGNRAERIEVA